VSVCECVCVCVRVCECVCVRERERERVRERERERDLARPEDVQMVAAESMVQIHRLHLHLPKVVPLR